MGILITGGAGFIGSKLIAHLQAGGIGDITVLDNFDPQIHGDANLARARFEATSGCRVIKADICDFNALSDAVSGARTVYHLVSSTGTGQSMYKVRDYYQTNVQGTATLIEAILHAGKEVQKVVLTSSRSVYGEGLYACEDGSLQNPDVRAKRDLEAGMFDHFPGQKSEFLPNESMQPVNPISNYAATKLSQEYALKTGLQALDVQLEIVRLQNVYGPGQSVNNPYTGIISIFLNQILQGRAIDIYEDGLVTRDFVHVNDVARALADLRNQSLNGEIMDIGSGVQTTLEGLAKGLYSALGVAEDYVISGKFRPGDIRNAYSDNARLARFNAQPLIAFETGLRETANWAKTEELCHISVEDENLKKLYDKS